MSGTIFLHLLQQLFITDKIKKILFSRGVCLNHWNGREMQKRAQPTGYVRID
jgi:hypothetical protein